MLEKDISMKIIQEALGNTTEQYIKKEVDLFGTPVTLKVRSILTLAEKTELVNHVLNACFDEDGYYQPELFDDLFNIVFLQVATNVPVLPDTDNPEAIDLDKMKAIADVLLREEYGISTTEETCHWDCYNACCEAVKERIRRHQNQQQEALTDTLHHIADLTDAGKALLTMANGKCEELLTRLADEENLKELAAGFSDGFTGAMQEKNPTAMGRILDLFPRKAKNEER